MNAAALSGLWWDTRIALARAWPRWGDANRLRLRRAAAAGEGDMHASAAEQMYGQLYLDHIRAVVGRRRGLQVLDVGCQSGRLALPLAAEGHGVTGLDLSPKWLAHCEHHARERGLSVKLVEGSVHQAGTLLAPQRYDLVLCTELLYALPDLPGALAVLRSLLAPGGALVTSHRTRHYMLLTLARFGRWDDADLVARADEGPIFGGQHYSWFDTPGLQALYAACGLKVQQVLGLGCCSGMGVDGLAGVCNADELSAAELQRLVNLERRLAPLYPDAARYRLLVAIPA